MFKKWRHNFKVIALISCFRCANNAKTRIFMEVIVNISASLNTLHSYMYNKLQTALRRTVILNVFIINGRFVFALLAIYSIHV